MTWCVPSRPHPASRRPARGAGPAAAPVAAVALVALLGACGTDAGKNDTPAEEPPLRLAAAWARQADSGKISAAYLTLENRADAPVAIRQFGSEAVQAVELHENMTEDGMTHMHARAILEVPAGGRVTMAPGGLHLMLIGTQRTLAPGDTVRLTLEMEDGRSQQVAVPVQRP